jgi:hypothetical protein
MLAKAEVILAVDPLELVPAPQLLPCEKKVAMPLRADRCPSMHAAAPERGVRRLVIAPRSRPFVQKERLAAVRRRVKQPEPGARIRVDSRLA